MDGKTLARIGAIAFVAIAITVAVINLSQKDETSQSTLTPVVRTVGAPDPLQAELTRCKGMGEAATRDPACLSAWAENRRRFLGEGR